jgi:hypothetical protein
MAAGRSPETGSASQSGYPALDEGGLSALAARLEAIVELLHGGQLTEQQRREMRLSLTAQIANGEALHRFRLVNSDEPAFMFHAWQG